MKQEKVIFKPKLNWFLPDSLSLSVLQSIHTHQILAQAPSHTAVWPPSSQRSFSPLSWSESKKSSLLLCWLLLLNLGELRAQPSSSQRTVHQNRFLKVFTLCHISAASLRPGRLLLRSIKDELPPCGAEGGQASLRSDASIVRLQRNPI